MNAAAQATKKFLMELGISDVGFFRLDEQDSLPYGVTLAVQLSDAVVDEITDKPTHSYFHHYRTVNAFLDHCSLRLGLFLQSNGYRYIPVPASQSIEGYAGRFSHKQGACLSGMGTVGRSGLFLHREYGPRVRLATVLTDCDFGAQNHAPVFLCGNCRLCVTACPATAILGGTWEDVPDRMVLLDPAACSEYMKRHFQGIGRGAVCGICMKVCPMVKDSTLPKRTNML